MIDSLLGLGEQHAWIVAPVGQLDSPLGDAVGKLDFMLRDPIATALERHFFQSEPGETLIVAPGETPLAGILLVGYGRQQVAWDDAMDSVLAVLPRMLPETAESVGVLPPFPTSGRLPAPWRQCAERYVPVVRRALPRVKRWYWIDLMEEKP